MIKNIIIILIILAILILSQQSYFGGFGKNLYKKTEEWGRILWQKCEDFWNKNILHRVTSEIEKRQNIAKQEIEEQTKEVAQTIWQKIKDYILGFFRSIFNQTPQENKQ